MAQEQKKSSQSQRRDQIGRSEAGLLRSQLAGHQGAVDLGRAGPRLLHVHLDSITTSLYPATPPNSGIEKADSRQLETQRALGRLGRRRAIQLRQPSLDHDDIFLDLLNGCPAIKTGACL